MIVLVLGATGLIGNRLVRSLKPDFDVFGTTRKTKLSNQFTDQMLEESHWILNSTPTEFSILEREVRSLKPNIIVNCLGVIKSKLIMFDAEESISVFTAPSAKQFTFILSFFNSSAKHSVKEAIAALLEL